MRFFGLRPRRQPVVVFLDVDGVLVPADATDYDDFSPSSLACLKHLVSALDACIVLSTSWRQSSFLKARLLQELRRHGLKVFGETPTIESGCRADEIRAWLAAHPPCIAIIIDDDPAADIGHSFWQTEPLTGLTPALVEQVLLEVGNDGLKTRKA